MFQSALARVGIAKQTVKGTPAANPMFALGVKSGAVASVDIDQDDEDITSATRISPGSNRTAVKSGETFTSRVFARSIGLYMFLALGAKAVSGAGPYIHVITNANVLTYGTLFGEQDGNLFAVQDGIVDELSLKWDGAGPVELSVTAKGTILNLSPTFVATTDESGGAITYMAAAGGTFKLDVSSATPATARVTAGEIKIKNNAEEVILSASVVPDDVFVGQQEFDVSLTIVPNDYTDWRKAVTGTGAGTTASQVAIYGSYEVQFTDGTNTLKVAQLRVAFLADLPEADPKGGPQKLELKGRGKLPASGAAMTATVTNTQVSY
jgi:hypothetical protein